MAKRKHKTKIAFIPALIIGIVVVIFLAAIGTSGNVGQFTATKYTLITGVKTTGTGSVTSSDGNLNCATSCSYSYAKNAQVTITATPSSSSRSDAVAWHGCTSVSGMQCTVKMDKAKTTYAEFFPKNSKRLDVAELTAGSKTPVGQVLSVSSAGHPDGKIICEKGAGTCTWYYPTGTRIILEEGLLMANTQFGGWTVYDGAPIDWRNTQKGLTVYDKTHQTVSVDMSIDRTVVAYFQKK